MAEIRIYVQCICGSLDLELIRKDSTTIKRMTDHILIYRCRACGERKVLGLQTNGGLEK